MEDLWEHALTVLEEQDISELHKFHDDTGILESHRKHFDHFKDANTKDVYFELIKMMLEREMAEKPSPRKCKDIKEVRKIQGYQDLTNKLFRRMTKQLVNNYVVLKERMDKLEGMLGSGGELNLTDKLNDLDYKVDELERRAEAKIAGIKEENMNHDLRLNGVEKEVAEIQDKLHAREEIELVEAEQARIQKEVVEALEKRIDLSDKNLDMLMENDKKQDETLATLEASLPNLDSKLKALESADEFFQEAHKDIATKAQGIEDEGKKMGISIKELADALEHFKEEKELSDQKIKGKLEILTGDDEEIRKKLDDFIEKQAHVDEKQNKDLESLENDVKTLEENLRNLQTDQVDGKERGQADLEHLKKNVDEVGEKIRQLEGISNQNAGVINEFTIKHITYNDKFDKLEHEASEFSGRVMEMLEDRRRECHDNAEDIKQLNERVKYNYDRLDTLTEIPLKVQNLEHTSHESGQNLANLRDMLHRLEGDINNNSEKIAIEANDRERGDDDLNNRIDQLRRDAEAVLARLEGVDDQTRTNLEKIIGLEEAHVTQLEKAVYVESLASRVTAIDEAKQMSEAKMKEELEENVKGNKDAISKLYEHFTERLDEIKGVNASQTGDIEGLKQKSSHLEHEIEKVRDDSRRLVDEELDRLAERLKLKVDEIDAICGKNEKHVENLRELNGKLMDDLEKSKADSLQKMDERLEAIRKEIPNIDPADFASLVESKFQLEAKLNDLLERAKILSDELEDTKKDVEGKHSHTHTIIRETTERTDSTLRQLEEKVTVIEKVQFENQDGLRKELDDLKDQTKKAETDLEEKIKQVDNQARQGIEGVGHQVEERAKAAQRHYQGLRIDVDVNKRDLWTIFLEMYGTMRCYTVVMKSEGGAAEHQSACLGVYRSVDWCNDRPVYKQENGENYLYFNGKLKSWMVASYVGNEYAWMKYQVHDDDDDDDKGSSSSGSSSSSDSDDDGEEKRLKRKKAKKISWRGLRAPDLFNPGWQYKLSPFSMDEETIERWMTDDQTLRVEPLGDVEKLTGLIQNVRKTKESIEIKS